MNYYAYPGGPGPMFQPQMAPMQQMPQQMPQQAPQQPVQPQYVTPMDRIAQLQYDAQMRDQQAIQAQHPGPKLINVGSIEEAKGFLSPADGSRVYFVNSSNGEIYSKQLDLSTGKSTFYTYRLQENDEQEQRTVGAADLMNMPNFDEFIKKDDFNALKREYNKLKDELTKLKKKMGANSKTDEEDDE